METSVPTKSEFTEITRNETFNAFFNNPMGKGTSFGNIKIILDGLEAKYRALYANKNKEFKLRVLAIKNDLFFQVTVPSETVDRLTYDIVIKFIDGNGKSNLAGSNIKLFSNNPHFNYTYAYAFKRQQLLIDELTKKINKKALTEIPLIKNTELVTGFEKSLFFAYFFIMSLDAIKSSFFETMKVSTNLATLNKLIKSTDDKEKEYNLLKSVMVKENKKKTIKLAGTTKKDKLTTPPNKNNKVSPKKKQVQL